MNHDWNTRTEYCQRCGCHLGNAWPECRDDLIAISHRRALAIAEESERRASAMRASLGAFDPTSPQEPA